MRRPSTRTSYTPQTTSTARIFSSCPLTHIHVGTATGTQRDQIGKVDVVPTAPAVGPTGDLHHIETRALEQRPLRAHVEAEADRVRHHARELADLERHGSDPGLGEPFGHGRHDALGDRHLVHVNLRAIAAAGRRRAATDAQPFDEARVYSGCRMRAAAARIRTTAPRPKRSPRFGNRTELASVGPFYPPTRVPFGGDSSISSIIRACASRAGPGPRVASASFCGAGRLAW